MLFARSRPHASRTWSREETDPELLREYDAFGPWIYEVRSEGDMPRRFRPHWARLAGARFLLKLPAPVDRPAAQPGQDLYRAVLAVHDDRVAYLELAAGEIVESTIGVGDIVAVRNDTFLLTGELALHLAAGSGLRMTYNTVSQELIEDVVDHLRARIAPGVPAPRQPPPELSDHWLRHLAVQHTLRSASSTLVYCEERGRAFRDPGGRRRRARGLLALDTGGELILISRGDNPYATSRSYLPHAALRGHDVREEPTGRARTRQVLRVQLPGHAVEVEICGAGEPLLAHLAALEGAQRGREPRPPSPV